MRVNTRSSFSVVLMIRSLLPIAALSVLVVGVSMTSSCGSENAFEVLNPPDQKQQGEKALAQGDYAKAISSLEEALQSRPNDPEIRKMLANAYMSQSGVDTLKILSTVAENNEKSDWGALIAAMPEGTSTHQANLQRAVAVLGAIPEGQRTPDERYQLAVAQTSLAVVTAKKYGVDADGQVPADKVQDVSDGDAEIILEQLSGASRNLEAVEQPSVQSASKKISGVVDQISGAAGVTSGDKVRSFLSKPAT